jgi:hypothetical protein
MRGGSHPTFSAGRRWTALVAVLISVASVISIVLLVNYASQRHLNARFFLSSQTEAKLSSQTVSLLRSLTNDVEIILYYDRNAPLFSTVSALAAEYRLASSRVQLRTVDYLMDPATAAQLKLQYHLSSLTEKDLVIVECEGRHKIVPGSMLAEYTLEQVPNEEELEFRKKPVLFRGEQVLTSVLLAVTQPKPLLACFLQGHGEHRPDNGDEHMGYLKLASLFQQQYLRVQGLTLLGTNTIPPDCSLLVIAGVTDFIPETELAKVERWIEQGGRAMILLNRQSVGRRTGLERLLARWGVALGNGVVVDPDRSTRGTGVDLVIDDFGEHPLMKSLNSRLHFYQPRPVEAVTTNGVASEGASVAVLARSRPEAQLLESASVREGPFAVAAAVERSPAPGVVVERGSTRLVVVGDSVFLGNEMIESAGNRDFAVAAINWLLDRSALLEGIGPRPVTEYRLVMSESELTQVQWLLLGAFPAGVLAIGGLAWLRHRK